MSRSRPKEEKGELRTCSKFDVKNFDEIQDVYAQLESIRRDVYKEEEKQVEVNAQ